LRANDSTVLDVRSPLVTGLKPGHATVGSTFAASVLAPVTITVSETEVVVRTLEAILVESVQLVAASSVPKLGSLDVRTSISSNFTREFANASVFVRAVMSDGQRQEVTSLDGVSLVSTNPSVVASVSSLSPHLQTQAVGSGTAFLDLRWQPTTCFGLQQLATARLVVDVALPLPTSVRVTVDRSVLAAGGNLASFIENNPVPTRTGVNVVLVYPDYEQDMTLDSRTIFDTSLAGSRLEVQTDANGASLVARAGASSGEATLRVRFSHLPTNNTVRVTIVVATTLSVGLVPES